MTEFGLGIRPARPPKPQAMVSSELKGLGSAIQDQQRKLLVAALGVALFLVAPRSDELLTRGVTELEKLKIEDVASKIEAQVNASVGNPLEEVWSASQIKQAVKPQLQETSAQKSELGVGTPETLKDIVAFTELPLRRCKPVVDTRVWTALLSLSGSQVSVKVLSLRAVWDAETATAAKSVIAAAVALNAAAESAKILPKADSLPPALSSPPDEKIFFKTDQGGAYQDNPAYARWKADNAKYQSAKNAAEKVNARQAELTKQLSSSKDNFVTALVQLGHAKDAQLRKEAGAPPSVVVTMTLEPSSTLKSLDIPANCVQTEVIAAAERANLPKVPKLIQASSAWPEISAAPLELAVAVADRSLLKTEQTLNVFGFNVHQRLISRIGPLALAAMMLWNLVHVRRFRSALRESQAVGELATLEKLTPSLPTSRNVLLTLLVASSVAVVSLSLAYLNREDVLSLIGGAAAAALSIAIVVTTLSIKLP